MRRFGGLPGRISSVILANAVYLVGTPSIIYVFHTITAISYC